MTNDDLFMRIMSNIPVIQNEKEREQSAPSQSVEKAWLSLVFLTD